LRYVAVVAAPLAAVAVLVAAPSASALTTGTLTQVPDHPWAGTSKACDAEIAASTSAGSVNYPGSEVEPYVAVDPQNSSNLVAAFQQDRWNDGGNNGDVAVVSGTGGTSWTVSSNQAAFSICAAGTTGTNIFDRSSDPSVAWSSDGNTVYQAGLAFNANGPAFGGSSSVQVSTSTNDGSNWGTPVVVQQDNSFTVLNDKEWITADPTMPGNAYLVWDRLVSPSTTANPDAFTHTPAFKGPALFSKTTDGGKTWSPSKIIFDPGQFNQTIDNEIVAPAAGPAAGDLLDGFVLIRNKPFKPGHNPFSIDVIRSTDGGATWSGPTTVSSLDLAEVSSLTGQPYRTGDLLPQFTSDQSGNLYVVWQDGRFGPNGLAKVAFSESTNGGTTWSSPIEIDGAPAFAAAFTPQITVNSDGTIGVTYYSTQNASAFSTGGGTDEYIVDCSSNCTSASSWTGQTLLSTSGTFDMTTAPNAGGFFVGDYEGLTPSGSTFDPFFVMAQPIATAGPTDPFFNTVS
jgi:hypothetical protein